MLDNITKSSFSVACIVVFFISLTTSYAQENNNTQQVSNKLDVVTSVAPITNIVQNIGGDKINLIGLVPEGVNSHTFELVPSDAIKINDADLVIIDGLNLETVVEKIAQNAISKNPSIQLLKLGDNTISQDQWVFDLFSKRKR